MNDRLQQQIQFLMEIDKMKTVLRRNLIADGSRRENDAEHCWHLATAAMVLQEYAANRPEVDLCRALQMALIHDLVEIYAGDTFAYDVEGNRDKEERERLAADRLFGSLPADQGPELRALWEEFDAMETPDSRYAAALDRLIPFLHNTVTDGYTWKKGNVTKAQVLNRMEMVRVGTPEIWPLVESLIEEHVRKGQIKA